MKVPPNAMKIAGVLAVVVVLGLVIYSQTLGARADTLASALAQPTGGTRSGRGGGAKAPTADAEKLEAALR